MKSFVKTTLSSVAIATTIVLFGAVNGASAATYEGPATGTHCTGVRSVSVVSTQLGNGYHLYKANNQVKSTYASATTYTTQQTYSAVLNSVWSATASAVQSAFGTCV